MKTLRITSLIAVATLALFINVSSANAAFDVNLKYGTRVPATKELQEFLVSKDYLVSANITGYFGALTLKAVKKFQTDSNLPATGFWGTLSRAKANEEIDLAASDAQEQSDTGTITPPVDQKNSPTPIPTPTPTPSPTPVVVPVTLSIKTWVQNKGSFREQIVAVKGNETFEAKDCKLVDYPNVNYVYDNHLQPYSESDGYYTGVGTYKVGEGQYNSERKYTLNFLGWYDTQNAQYYTVNEVVPFSDALAQTLKISCQVNGQTVTN